jgi:histidinol-phosphate aminotransferase
MSKYLRERLNTLAPYTPGEQPREIKYIKLNTNESPFPPAPEVSKVSRQQTQMLNLYSDPTCRVLKEALAERYGVSVENVSVSNGSDEVLAFAFQAYGENGFTGPALTYGFYPVFADFFGIDYKTVPMKEDLSIDLDALINSSGALVIANPNAQTGLYIEKDEIERLVVSSDRIVIVDEAYIDFGGETAVPLTKKYPNLLVTGTFSKSRNLAGARIGFCIGDKNLISDIERLRFSFNPYNLNRISLAVGAEAIRDEDYFKSCTSKIIYTRESFKKKLLSLGFSFPDSRANFILAKKDGCNGKELYTRLREKGILVRYLGDEIIRDYIRITIGSEEEMESLYVALKEILKEDLL